MKTARLPGTGVFWYWNATPSENGIRKQLKSIADAGFSCVYLHPMPDAFRKCNFFQGMKCAYLGKRYFELAHIMLDECKRLGLFMMLYDEGGWPSGGVLDRLIKQHPECRARFLFRTENGVEERVEEFPDLFDRTTTEIFIQMTHELYKNEFGSEFGKTIRGIFTDEPFFRCAPGGDGIRIIRGMRELFRKEYDCDFERDILPRLWKGTGTEPGAPEARRKYMRVCTELFARNYSGVLAAWCRRNGLEFEGHFNHEEAFFLTGDHGEILSYLAPLDVPGIDAIWRQIFPGLDCHYPRLAASAAIRSRRKEALCECFNVYGYGLTTSQMNWIVNTLLIQGINRILPMPYLYSDRGKRKICCSTDFSPRIPQWRAMPELNRAWKIAAQFDVGATEPPVLVFARTENPSPDYPPPEFNFQAENRMNELLNKLDRHAIPWRFADLGDLEGTRTPEALVYFGKPDRREADGIKRLKQRGCAVFRGWNDELKKFASLELSDGETPCRVLPCKRREGKAWMIFNPLDKAVPFRFRSALEWREITVDPVLPELCPIRKQDGIVSFELPAGALRIIMPGRGNQPDAEFQRIGWIPQWSVTAVERMHMSATGATCFKRENIRTGLPADGLWHEPDFSGILTLETELKCEKPQSGYLCFDKLLHAGELSVNGKFSGLRAFAPWAFPVTLKAGINRLRLKIFSGAGNEWRRCFREELEPRGWFNVYAQRIREFSMDDAETGVGSASLLLKVNPQSSGAQFSG